MLPASALAIIADLTADPPPLTPAAEHLIHRLFTAPHIEEAHAACSAA